VGSFPSRAECVLGDLLEIQAAARPDEVFALFDDGGAWSFGETAERSRACAHGFLDLGLRRREPLVAWLPNGREALLAWFGTVVAGLTYTPLNTGYRGRILQESLNLLEARVLVAHAGLVQRLAGLDLPHLELLVVVGDATGLPAGLPRAVGWESFTGERAPAPPALAEPVEPWDDQMVMFTSGTTGASKAVRRPHVLYLKMAEAAFDHVGVGSGDRFLVCAPMFHGGGDVPIYAMLRAGGSVAIVPGFRTHAFWDDVRRFECTIAWIHSAMSLFLWKQPPRPDDRDHPLRLAMQAPLMPNAKEFADRFGIRLYTVYGMTEMPCIFSIVDPTDHRSLGKPWDPDYDVRLVDEHDREVLAGIPGELVARHRIPWAITPGYAHQPEATARVWRNGWFHSGDVFVRDENGDFRLVDRVKDSIRRRGENVSSAEVERELLDHPAIAEAAVIGVEAQVDQEVLAVVVRRAEVEPEELIQFLAQRLPYFAVPRYIEFVEEIPRNAGLRPDKILLRERGITAAAWDREAVGIKLKRERL
jgi:crotonobetaine/carnitine-CoA ligase